LKYSTIIHNFFYKMGQFNEGSIYRRIKSTDERFFAMIYRITILTENMISR
jgi:hypothetical protein